MPTAHPFDAEPKRVTVNGLSFAYHEAGEGPLALLVHGFPDTPHGFRDIVPSLLDAGYRVVAPFTRGYAPTEAPPTRAITLEELASDVIGLIDALGDGRPATLIGHDWGAATSYLATATAPEKIERLVAIGIPHPATIRPSLRLLWIGRHFITLRLPFALARARRSDFRMIDTFYRRWSPTWDFGPAETAPVKACFADPASLDAAIGYYRGAKPGHVAPPLREKIAVPTLVVAGEDDPAVGVDAYEAARRKFDGDYRVVALPGGHFVHRESPERFREALLEFLPSR